MNSLAVYEDAGRKAGRARNHHDEGMAKHWSEWVRRALRLEEEPYRTAARKVYDAAYKEARS